MFSLCMHGFSHASILRLPLTIQNRPPSMHVRSGGDSKLAPEVNVRVHVCLSHLTLCGTVMDLKPVQGVPRLSPNGSWDRHPKLY